MSDPLQIGVSYDRSQKPGGTVNTLPADGVGNATTSNLIPINEKKHRSNSFNNLSIKIDNNSRAVVMAAKDATPSNNDYSPPASNTTSRSGTSTESRTQDDQDLDDEETNPQESEFHEMLDADNVFDFDRLRDAARHGIPENMRGEVWKYLLNVSIPDKSEEVTHAKKLRTEYQNLVAECIDLLQYSNSYDDVIDGGNPIVDMTVMMVSTSGTTEYYRRVMQRVKAEIKRQYSYDPHLYGNKETRERFERTAFVAFLTLVAADQMCEGITTTTTTTTTTSSTSGRSVSFGPQQQQVVAAEQQRRGAAAAAATNMTTGKSLPATATTITPPLFASDDENPSAVVNMIAPFVKYLDQACDIHYCFHAHMKLLRPMLSRINEIVGELLMLFRWTQTELYHYFEEEEVEPSEWAFPWVRYLFACHFPIHCVARLWDTYYAHGNVDLHPYVCLAVLQNSYETLMELEHSEIKLYLHNLPAMNMDKIIKQAYNIKEDVRQKLLPSK